MYAKDISRKVRSTKKLLAQEGKFANSRAPYGYKKSPEDKHKLVIDENASQIVEFIFSQYLKGETGRSIADKLNRKNIPTPNNYYYQSINKPNPYIKDKNKWSSGTIMGIIKNPAYYGAIANCKRTVKSFKNKNVVSLPKEQWVVVENMHQPIIPKEQWEAAQKINIDNKHEGLKRRCNGKMNIFSGLLKCADCGGNMIFNTKYYKSYTKEYYRCSTYMSKGKMACTHHSIDYNIIYRAVMDDIKKYAALSEEDEEKFRFESKRGFASIPYKYSETVQEKPEEGHLNILKNFTGAILRGEKLISPGTDGVNEITLANAAYLSAWTGSPVELPLDCKSFDNELEKRISSSKTHEQIKEEFKINSSYSERWQVRW